jgi:subtilisin family serine protease
MENSIARETPSTDPTVQTKQEPRLISPEDRETGPAQGKVRQELENNDLAQEQASEDRANGIPVEPPSATPFSESAYARILKEITYDVLDSQIVQPASTTSVQKRISLRKTSFKYPFLIVEESVRVHQDGKEVVENAQALVATHVMVNLRTGADLDTARIRLDAIGCSLKEKIADDIYLVTLKGKPSIETHFEKRAALAQIDDIFEVVEPDYFVTIVKTPDDKRFSSLWGLHNTGSTGGKNDKDIDAPEAWDLSTGSKNVLGAVIDTGIDRNHEDLKANMWTNPGEIAGNGKDDDGNGFIDDVHGWDFANDDNDPFDDNSHGTHCAGTIGGVGNNGKGVVGVAWNVSMVGIKFLDSSGSGSGSDAVKSVAYATKIGVRFTSNSWGGGGASSSLRKVIEDAGKKGIGFIAAAGNHRGDNDRDPSYPASYDLENVIAVGAHGNTGKSASFSCYGKKSVDLFAPGVSILSSVPRNKYASYSGTSMATPHVAGAYALIQSIHPEWSCNEIKASMMSSTDDEDSLKEKCVTGGRLNIFKALQVEPPKDNRIAARPTLLEFGKLSKNTPKTLGFSLINDGSIETAISKASVSEDAFVLSFSTPVTLEPGKELKGSITFAGKSEGTYEGNLVIVSDAKNTPSLVVPLTAEVTTTPDIGVSPENMHFGLRDNETKTQSLVISNSGDGELTYEIFVSEGNKGKNRSASFTRHANERPVDSEIFQHDHVPGELIVGFKPGHSSFSTNAFSDLKAVKNLNPSGRLGGIRSATPPAQVYLFAASEGVSLDDLRTRMLKDPRIAYVEPNYIMSSAWKPNDPNYNLQWELENVGQAGGTKGADVSANEAWEIHKGSAHSEVVVGVIDTGVDFSHPDMKGSEWTNPGEIPGNGIDDDQNGYVDDVNGYDFVNNRGKITDGHGHGTHNASTIAARMNNGIGITGYSKNVRIASLNFLNASGRGSLSDAIEALNYATSMGISVTNNSWGGGSYSQALKDAIDAAGEKGYLFVTSAGNSGKDVTNQRKYPLCFPCDNIIGVGSSDRKDNLASYSNWSSTHVDLVAPGLSYGAIPGGKYKWNEGTSNCAPQVAGAIALLKSYNSQLSGPEIKEVILGSTDTLPSLVGKTVSGGRLNAHKTLQSQSPLWLEVGQSSGTVPPGQSISLKVSAYAERISGKKAEANLVVRSNDPDEPSKNVRVTAEILDSKNGLSFEPSSISFEETFVGHTKEKELVVSNGGTKTVTISQFLFLNSSFSHRLNLPVGIKPGEKISTKIYFTPKQDGRIDSSALILTDEDGNRKRNLPVSGRASFPPVMVVTPSALSATLGMKKGKTLQAKISNTGGSPLHWTLEGATGEGGKFLSQPQVFGQSHFRPLVKGMMDERKGAPVSTLGGGPDRNGYSWTDSTDPAGPAHEWTDISKTGKLLGQLSEMDDGYAKVALPFAMELYGKKFSEVFVNSNGYLSFDAGSIDHGHFPLPTSMMPGNLVAPFAMDLDPSRGGEIYFKGTADEFIVQWNRVKDFAGIGEYTFQASLNRNGVFYFHYEKMDGKIERATTGIQNATGDVGLLVAYNNKQLTGNSTVRVSTSPKWLHASITSGVVPANQSIQVPLVLTTGNMQAGKYEATISISGDDPENPLAKIPVSLTVQATRELTANPSSIDFGLVEVGVSKKGTVEITNTGNTMISISGIKTGGNEFKAGTIQQTFEPGSKTTLEIQFTPTNAVTYQTNCEIQSNAENSPTIVRLTGKGLASPRLVANPGGFTLSISAGKKSSMPGSIINSGKADGRYFLKEIRNGTQNNKSANPPKSDGNKADPFLSEHLPNRLIVRYKEGHSSFANSGTLGTKVKLVRELGKARKAGHGARALFGLSLSLVETSQNTNLREIARKLSQDPAVEYVEPDYIRRSSEVPNDPEWSRQYALSKIQAPQAWEKTKGSHSVIVAVIDTGIDYNHKDLQGNIWKNPGEIPNNGKDDDGNGYVDDVYGWDFRNNDNDPMDGNRHGTHVAGTIAAASNNGLQVAGVAWQAKLVALKFLADEGWGSVSDAIDAVAYCTAMNFPISNNSWGGGGSSKAMKEAIDRAGQNGHLFCAAAGNSGENNDKNPHYPSSYTSPSVISVAASDSADRLASFTCYGKTSVDLAAPGVSILNLVPNNRIAKLSGTSMATPHVAGAAALVLSMNPNAGFAEIKQALMDSVDPIKSYQGKMVAPGRLNLLNALEGYSPDWLSVAPERGSVAAGKSASLTFTIDATELTAGTKRAIVCFETNDPLARVLEIPVEVTVTGEPEIALDKTSLNFGEIWVGQEKKLSLVVSNTGSDMLEVSKISTGHVDLSVNPSTFTLAPGEKERLDVTAKPGTSGELSTRMSIVSNDPKTPAAGVSITMNAVRPPQFEFLPKIITKTMEKNEQGEEIVTIRNLGEAQGAWTASLVEVNKNRSRSRNMDGIIADLNRAGRVPEFLNPGLPMDGDSKTSDSILGKPAERMNGGNAQSGLEVAILGANSSTKNKDVANGIASTKRFAGVTVIDVRSVTPTVNELKAFDSVIVYNNYRYFENEELGDNLADYADNGGGVVCMIFETSTRMGTNRPLGGRWLDEKYGLFSHTSKDTRNWNSLGAILQPSHALVDNFNTFEGYYRLNKKGVLPGSALAATWKDGLPLIAYRNDLASVVGLNFYPVSKRASSNGWDTGTDGWILMANALEWTTNGSMPSWLITDTLAGAVKGNGTGQIIFSFNSADLSEGNYSAEFRISSNDPVKPYEIIEVNLAVRENLPPVAKPSTVSLVEDTTKAFKLEGNDPDGDPLTFHVLDQPKFGRLDGEAPALTYVPNPNFSGTDDLVFKVSDGRKESETARVEFKVSPVNDAPWAHSSQLESGEDEPLELALEFGDSDGDRLEVEITKQPASGFVNEENGKWTFFPNAHYNGKDEIRFLVSDGKLKSKEATISISIQPANDAPIASLLKVVAEEGKRVMFELQATDVDGDPITYELVTAPKHGEIEHSKGKKWAFTPFAGYNGTDFLTFRTFDGKVRGNSAKVSFEVVPRNDPPVVSSSTFGLLEDGELRIKLIASDPEGDGLTFKITSPPAHGSIEGSGPTYTYAPEKNFNGTDTFTVVASDGQSNSQPAVITLLVSSQNDAPSLASEIGTLSASYRETTLRMKLKGEDPDGDELTYLLSQKPANGVCSINGDQLVYMPDPGFTGTEKIEIQVSDGKLSDVATLMLPIEEHPNAVGLFIDLDDSEIASDFLYNLYEMNERLQKTGKYLLRLDDEKMGNGFTGSISNEVPTIDAITLAQWKDQIQSFDPMTAFTFHPQAKGGEIAWQVTSFLENASGTDADLVNKDKSKVDNNKDEPKDPGESPDSPDPSSAPTEAPVVGISDLPRVVANTEAANWYSMNGLGSFFNAGNDWIYQPEMGWCFAKVNQSDLSVWVYNEQFGWMWFPTELPNVTYMVGELANGWTYFPKSSVTEAGILYDYTNESWLKLK